MGNLLVNDATAITDTNFLDFASKKNNKLIAAIQKEGKVASLFFYLDANNDGVLDGEEFSRFEKMSSEKVSNLVSLEEVTESKKVLDTNNLTKMMLKKQIEVKEEKIKRLFEEKKHFDLESILKGMGLSAVLGCVAKFILGGSLLAASGVASVGLIAVATSIYLHNKRIDSQIKELQDEILVLKSALILTT